MGLLVRSALVKENFTVTIAAPSRYHLESLIMARKGLEAGDEVSVWFPDGTKIHYKPADLQAVVWKIICNM